MNQLKVMFDKEYRFMSYFNCNTGMYVRTNVVDENNRETDEEPFQASHPHLMDIGIMGSCLHAKSGLCEKAGIQCYQGGATICEPNMSLENFELIARQMSGLVNQFALGGRGDVDCHEQFEEILACCRRYQIVPNYTTSGFLMTARKANLTKKYCGACAVSWYRSAYTTRAIKLLLEAGVTTNIHYVLSNSTIDEAIYRLKGEGFVDGIHAVIFLLHKPIGLGQLDEVLQYDDPRLIELFSLIDTQDFNYLIGFDTCSYPAVMNFSQSISLNSIDTCEAGRFSAYVSSDMIMVPCSFEQDKQFGVDLKKHTIKEAWNSQPFELFRSKFLNSCATCVKQRQCLGGCPISREVVLCKNSAKKQMK